MGWEEEKGIPRVDINFKSISNQQINELSLDFEIVHKQSLGGLLN